jgi:hypothetical protein
VSRLSFFTAFSAIFFFFILATAADPAAARKGRSARAKRATAAAAKPAAPAKPVVDPRPAQARKACAAGNVTRGIEILAEIVVENGDANAVYNQGRCYQQNGRPEEAVNRFREYLRTATALAPADRMQVEGFIKELEAEIEVKARRQAALAAADAAASKTPSSSPAAAAATSSAPDAFAAPPPAPARTGFVAVRAPTPPAPDEPSPSLAQSADAGGAEAATALRPRQTAAIAAGAAGVVGLAAGVYFGWRTGQISQQIEKNQGPLEFAELDRQMASGRQSAALQWVGYGVGAASLAAAAALLYWDRPSDGPGDNAQASRATGPQESRFIILPTVHTGAAGVSAGALVRSPF